MLLLAKFALIVAGLVVQGVSDGAIPDGRLDRLGAAGLATISAMLAGAGLLLLAVRWYGRRQTPPGLGRQARLGREASR